MAKGSNNKTGSVIKLTDLLDPGISLGLHELAEENPIFLKKEKFLENYIDERKAIQYLNRAMNYSKKRHQGTLDMNEVNMKMANYVKRGTLFNERGKEIILNKSLYEHRDLGEKVKGFVLGHFPSATERIQIKDERGIGGLVKSYLPFTSENYLVKNGRLDRTTKAFTELYELMKTGDYAERMPDLAEAVTQVYDTGFFKAAAKILYEGKLLSPTRYAIMERNIYKRTKAGTKYVTRALKYHAMPHYSVPLRATGVFLGVIGLGSLLMNNSITGNVVGAGNPNIFGLLGGVLLIISGILLWFKKKKQVKYKTKRKKNIKNKKKR